MTTIDALSQFMIHIDGQLVPLSELVELWKQVTQVADLDCKGSDRIFSLSANKNICPVPDDNDPLDPLESLPQLSKL